MKLEIIIEKDKTGYWVAEVPIFPGCVSQGRTIAEAKANIKEVIESWVAIMNIKVKHRKARIVEITV